MRGSRRTASWVTMAGVGWFTARDYGPARRGPKNKGSAVARAALRCGEDAAYLAAVFSASSALAAADLPNFLKNLSTRPPMSLTDFCVPV
jgi:hypothetical protein